MARGFAEEHEGRGSYISDLVIVIDPKEDDFVLLDNSPLFLALPAAYNYKIEPSISAFGKPIESSTNP